MEGPGVKCVVHPAGEAVGVVVDRRVEIIGVGAGEAAPVSRGTEKIRRAVVKVGPLSVVR